MKILNLYSGLGGNRKLWPITDKDEVVAVENNPEIAAIYQSFFPKDKVVVADAHQYLLEHYKEFDFIWSSPPCPSHSDVKRASVQGSIHPPEFPDMKLYEEIIFLTHFSKIGCLWVLENVRPYYEPLIKPQYAGRHAFWSNFLISSYKREVKKEILDDIRKLQKMKGFDLGRFKINDKRRLLRNCVMPKLGLHVWNCAFKTKQEVLNYGR